jgi:drug/metabolite transporter (DMT)-like permease
MDLAHGYLLYERSLQDEYPSGPAWFCAFPGAAGIFARHRRDGRHARRIRRSADPAVTFAIPAVVSTAGSAVITVAAFDTTAGSVAPRIRR